MSGSPGITRVGQAALCAALMASAPFAAASQPSAPALLRAVEQGAASVRVELRAAREANDPVLARCVSAKLSELHAQLRLAEQHAARHASAAETPERRRHRYLLEVAHERAHELAVAARRCSATRPALVRVVRR